MYDVIEKSQDGLNVVGVFYNIEDAKVKAISLSTSDIKDLSIYYVVKSVSSY